MNAPAWQCDDHGTLNLVLGAPCLSVHAWIAPRRPYCDRGHWEWGHTGPVGLGAPHAMPPAPSHYFMRLESAIAEVEAWLAAALAPPPAVCLPTARTLSFSQRDGRALGWSWHHTSPHVLTARAVAGELHLCALDIPTAHLRLSAHGIDDLDRADGFPRHYLCPRRAMAEAEEFLAWRLLKVPAQVPAPLTLPDRPVGQALLRALMADRLASSVRRAPSPTP